ncbi:MAG: acetoacetate decarboxylase family protein [Actinomycetota bacterium]
MVTVKGIPLDAPLYEIDAERGVEYWGCKALAAFFTIDGDVSDLLPAGLRLAGDPALGAVLIADYGGSTLGHYNEFVSLIQVVGLDGKQGMYVPYIYVTNDAAMAAGRELLGAPKKLAHIEITQEYDLIQGTFERPRGKRLVTFTMKPSTRLSREAMEAVLPNGTPLYSLRQSPPVDGRGGTSELVQWFSDLFTHVDASGKEILFAGPASITYDSPSVIDPVHRLGIGTMLAAAYTEFDMALRPGAIVERPAEQRKEEVSTRSSG